MKCTNPAAAGNPEDVHGLVDHLFRHQAGRMVATLTRSLGPANLQLAEEVVQEALIQALKHWPFSGVPDRPGAWLYRVARNLALDRLRRDASFRGKESELKKTLEASAPPLSEPTGTGKIYLAGEITDDQLRLIFLCCHPALARDSRVALTLKAVAGFSVREIARAFLTREATVAQRLVRAKRRIEEQRLPFEVPSPGELPGRLEAVLEVIYLMFNEGYARHEGEELIGSDLCAEAVRWAHQLTAVSSTSTPTVHALAALLLLQASRLPARLNRRGDLVRLEEQDRERWDRDLIRRAFAHLERASEGREQSEYHLQAVIAAHHASALGFDATDWHAILELYDRLLARNPSPVVALNRAVALARVEGPAAGLAALAAIEEHPAVGAYYLLPATRAELLAQIGDLAGAIGSYRRALECPCSEPERRFLQAKLAGLEEGSVMRSVIG